GLNGDVITEPISRGIKVLTRKPMRDQRLEDAVHVFPIDIYNEIERSRDPTTGEYHGPHYHLRSRGGVTP
ncbi:MAG: hypothetical protein AB1758_36885, partial [Candidatus Eremiobacterota bacterium]